MNRNSEALKLSLCREADASCFRAPSRAVCSSSVALFLPPSLRRPIAPRLSPPRPLPLTLRRPFPAALRPPPPSGHVGSSPGWWLRAPPRTEFVWNLAWKGGPCYFGVASFRAAATLMRRSCGNGRKLAPYQGASKASSRHSGAGGPRRAIAPATGKPEREGAGAHARDFLCRRALPALLDEVFGVEPTALVWRGAGRAKLRASAALREDRAAGGEIQMHPRRRLRRGLVLEKMVRAPPRPRHA